MFPSAMAARSYKSLSCADFSMSSPFPKNGLCESSQFKGKGQGAQFEGHGSMHRRAGAVVGGPRRAVALIAQFTEQVHDRGFAGVDEAAARDVLGVLQQLFGFGQFFHAASVRGSALRRTQAFLFKAVSR